MPPYALPAEKTQSGIKTRSTKEGGADNFNELRFEDKKAVSWFIFKQKKTSSSMLKTIKTIRQITTTTSKLATTEKQILLTTTPLMLLKIVLPKWVKTIL
ncbi:hypothetical protein P4S63_18335 [Pseudoalteromonas sp. B193]